MSDLQDAMRQRHSVRRYLKADIPESTRLALESFVGEINGQSGLHVQILWDEPDCFASPLAHYGHFENCSHYLSMTGPKSMADLEEKCGYYGERIVLMAQSLGLNTCWAYLTHGKSKAQICPGEREVIVIALGIGATQGVPHQGKTPREVSNLSDDSPDWFRRGIEAALLAPTALNQQNFRLLRSGTEVTAETTGLGPCLKIDLGIVKCHFELAAGREQFRFGTKE
ncbi:MAG: nitroreductase [Clostridia bacterium]|nr:nitroreductase [Clostridia bacterium]